MTLARRLVFALLLAAATARACVYLYYTVLAFQTPLEAYHLEAKMVLLAYRAEVGASLYPRWDNYPHVANFFGPVYFGLVGLIGALVGATIPGLFLIGRAVTVAAALGTTALVAAVAGRRYGRAAGAAAAALSLGTGPLLGFGVMVRPDTLADLLGLAGFLLLGQRALGPRAAGGLLLVLAVLTKQTSALYLAAAVAALAVERRPRQAAGLLAGCALGLAAVIAGVNAGIEPNFAASLVGEASAPWALHNVVQTLYTARTWPELLVLPLAGIGPWLTARPRDVRLPTLAVVLLAGSVVASGKTGASLNYYLCLRGVEALAAGALWRAARAATGRALRAAVAAGVVGVAAVAAGTVGDVTAAANELAHAQALASPLGRIYLETRNRLFRSARDPSVRMLTDSGPIDLHHGTRAVFGDPWLFRLLVHTGRIDPVLLKQRIDRQYYQLIVTTSDIMAPTYETYEFGLPMVLVERIRTRYKPVGAHAALFFYVPRDAPGAGGAAAAPRCASSAAGALAAGMLDCKAARVRR
jgi:hypothetical protein